MSRRTGPAWWSHEYRLLPSRCCRSGNKTSPLLQTIQTIGTKLLHADLVEVEFDRSPGAAVAIPNRDGLNIVPNGNAILHCGFLPHSHSDMTRACGVRVFGLAKEHPGLLPPHIFETILTEETFAPPVKDEPWSGAPTSFTWMIRLFHSPLVRSLLAKIVTLPFFDRATRVPGRPYAEIR